jgi:hypothetical protein
MSGFLQGPDFSRYRLRLSVQLKKNPILISTNRPASATMPSAAFTT